MKNISLAVLVGKRSSVRSKTPWRLDVCGNPEVETADGARFGRRLFHYLSGGGMKVFGRTAKQEESDLKRTRFLVAAGVFAVVWFCFWI